MTNITLSISETEKLAMDSVCLDIQEYLQNWLNYKSRSATETIIDSLVAHCNNEGIAIGVGVDNQIKQAYDLGIVKTVEQLNADNEEL